MLSKNIFHYPIAIFIKATLVGSIGLFSFYYLILFAVTRDFDHPISQFKLLQPWMSVLIVGFGIQVGLFWLLRRGFRLKISEKKDTDATAGTGAAVSGISMIACCAHHVLDVIPILGLSGTTLFLVEYQKQFLILGIITNGLGILFILWMLLGKVKPTMLLAYLLPGKEDT